MQILIKDNSIKAVVNVFDTVAFFARIRNEKGYCLRSDESIKTRGRLQKLTFQLDNALMAMAFGLNNDRLTPADPFPAPFLP